MAYTKVNDTPAADIAKINNTAVADIAKCNDVEAPSGTTTATRWVAATQNGYIAYAANSDLTSWTSYDGYDESWYETYSKQVNALRGFLGGKGFVYSRDTGIMPYIEHVAKTKCCVSVKD